MMKISYSRLLTILCFVLPLSFLFSCKKDEAKNSGMVELISFGPTGAKHGDTIRFFGNNLDKVTAVQFSGTNAVVEQKDFKQQTTELILLVVPAAAEKGFVTLKTPSGDVVSKTQFNLSVAPTISAITPPQARPGENITITGNFLNWVNKVTFARDKVVTTFVSKSLNQLVVKVPDDAQTGPLVLFYQGTDSSFVQTTDTLKVSLPTITGMSPNPVKHAEDVTFTGTNLDLTTKVIFTGVATPVTTFVSKSATQLVVKVPGAAQKGKITLEAASGIRTTSSADLTITLPAITTMAPNPVDPGTNLTISGTNLDLVSSITFQNAPAVTSFVSKSATQIVVTVPMGVLRGKVTFGVMNSTVPVQSNDVLEVTGAVPPPIISFPIYNDAVTSNWNGWIGGGWGGTSNRDNAAPVREGLKSIKIDYVGGYGSPFQIGGANISLSSYTTFKFSIYGAPGSNGKSMQVKFNGNNGPAYSFSVVEGKWTDYAVPLSSLTGVTALTEVWIQELTGNGGFTVYADAIGLN
jgi:hypothetical protein